MPYLNGDRDIDLLNACFKAGFLEGQPGPLYSPRPLGALLSLVAAGSTGSKCYMYFKYGSM